MSSIPGVRSFSPVCGGCIEHCSSENCSLLQPGKNITTKTDKVVTIPPQISAFLANNGIQQPKNGTIQIEWNQRRQKTVIVVLEEDDKKFPTLYFSGKLRKDYRLAYRDGKCFKIRSLNKRLVF